MLFVPDAVSDMATKLEPHAEATKAHATQIANAGFEASHTGQAYREQGNKLAAGVDGVVAMLHSWSDTAGAAAGVLRYAVTTNVSADNEHASQLNSAAGGLG